MTWIKLASREGVDITTIAEFDLVFFKHTAEFNKSNEELFFTTFQSKTFTHYIKTNPDLIGRSLYQKYFNSPQQIKQYYQQGKKFLLETEKITKKWKAKPNQILAALEDFHQQFKEACDIYSITSFWAIETWQKDFEEIISSLIKRNELEQQREKIIFSACQPWKKTALPEIQEKLSKKEKIPELVEEYQFLRGWSAIWYRPLEESWIDNLGKSIDEEENTYSIKEIITLLHPNEKEKLFLEIAPYIVFFKDWRDDLRRKQVYLWSFLWDMIAEKLDIERNDLGYLTLEEIKTAISNGNVDKELIKRRKNNLVIIAYDQKKSTIIDQDTPNHYLKIIDQIENKNKDTVIKGLVAQKGKAKGVVRIVNSYHDIKKFVSGEILVANTTHPNYLPAMRQAVAFVTNEGGLTCHAAIVAREMKKPCIVGTKIATKQLLNGDLVEVDAEQGIVRKI